MSTLHQNQPPPAPLVIAAQPGYFLAEPMYERSGRVGRVLWVPIVGWALEQQWSSWRREWEHWVSPIAALCLSGPAVDCTIIKFPTGEMVAVCDGRWVNDAEAVEYFERHDEAPRPTNLPPPRQELLEASR